MSDSSYSLQPTPSPLTVTNGGTGAATLTGLIKGNGTSAFTAAVGGTDYQIPITLTTTGTSGAATFSAGTLNIPIYANTTYTAGTGLTLAGTSFSVNTSQSISTLSNLTSNGLIKTSGGTGALSIATAGTDYQTPLTFSTGLTNTTGTVTVNTSQNITTLSNFTTAGFVKTSAAGLLSVDTSTYLTANQTITLSGDVSGSGTTAITTAIGALKVTNAMLAGSIAASKLVGSDIATVGTITTGTWNGTIISPTYGGTGVNNGANTITLGGALTTSGAFATTLTVTAATNVTLPTTGTLATRAGTEVFTNKDLTSGTNTFPTFNQNTTGSAATLTTSRNINGIGFNGSANILVPSMQFAVAQTTHGFSVGSIVRVSTTSTYAASQANSAANAEVDGIVTTVVDANNFVLSLPGSYITGWTHGITPGATGFLSASSAGAITGTAPTGTNINKPIFRALTTTTGYFIDYRGLSATSAAGSYVIVNAATTGQYSSSNFGLTDGATIALDWNNGNVQSVTLGGNRTFTFANPISGGRYLIKVKQDGTGTRTLTWPTITWRGGSAPTLTTTINKTDLITLIYDGSTYYGDASLNY